MILGSLIRAIVIRIASKGSTQEEFAQLYGYTVDDMCRGRYQYEAAELLGFFVFTFWKIHDSVFP